MNESIIFIPRNDMQKGWITFWPTTSSIQFDWMLHEYCTCIWMYACICVYICIPLFFSSFFEHTYPLSLQQSCCRPSTRSTSADSETKEKMLNSQTDDCSTNWDSDRSLSQTKESSTSSTRCVSYIIKLPFQNCGRCPGISSHTSPWEQTAEHPKCVLRRDGENHSLRSF